MHALIWLIPLVVAPWGCEQPAPVERTPLVEAPRRYALREVAKHEEVRAEHVVFDPRKPGHWLSAGDWRLTTWVNTTPKTNHHRFVTRDHLALSDDGETILSDGRRYRRSDLEPIANPSPAPRKRGYETHWAAYSGDLRWRASLRQFRPPRGRRRRNGEGYTYAYPTTPSGPGWMLEVAAQDGTRQTLLDEGALAPIFSAMRRDTLVVSYDGALRRWRLRATPAPEMVTLEPALEATQMRFSPRGDRAIAVDIKGAVAVWATESWTPIAQVKPVQPSKAHVRAVALHPTRDLIATGSDDGHLTLWTFEGQTTWRPVTKLQLPAQQPEGFTQAIDARIDGLHFNPQGDMLIVGVQSARDTVYLYALEISGA